MSRRALLTVFLALLACRQEETPPAADAPAIVVGRFTWSAPDVQMRARLVQHKYPEAKDPHLGAAGELIKGSLCALALDRLGEPITPGALDQELARIDKETRDPEGLAQMKALFGGGQSRAYREVGIFPDFANSRYFFGAFPRHEGVHESRRKRAGEVLSEALASGPALDVDALASRLAREGWQLERTLFSDKEGFFPPGGGPPGPRPEPPHADPDAARYEKEIFSTLAAGQLFPKVVVLGDAFALLRWTGMDGARRKVEILRLPKRDAEDFLWEVASTVPVRVVDERLRQELKRRIPWLAHVPLGP